MNSIQCQSTSFSSHVLLLACINNVNVSTIDLHMHQIVSFRSLTFKFSSPYGCEWPKPHSNKHVQYPNKHPTNNTHRLNQSLESYSHLSTLKKHRKAFLLGKKITKRQNGTVSVNGIIHGSSLDRWHLMDPSAGITATSAKPGQEGWILWKSGASNYLQRIDPPCNERTARTWKMVVAKLPINFGPCLFQVLCECSGRVILSGRSMFVRLVRHLIEICIYKFWADGPGNI